MALINCPECGKEVSEAAVSCPFCGYGIKRHFNEISRKKQQELTQQKHDEWMNKYKTTLIIAIVLGIACIIAIVLLCINNHILSQRKTFDSVEEMQSYMKGTWEHKGGSVR